MTSPRSMPVAVWLLTLIVAGLFNTAARASVIDDVRQRGYVNCGVSGEAPGFSQVDSSGRWSGFDVEFCAAVAAAVLGDGKAVKHRALSSMERFGALRDGEVDLISGGSSWTLSRDSELGVRFVTTLFYDGQGFLVPRNHAVASIMELSGASICVLPGSSGARSVTDFFTRAKMRFQLVTSDRWDDLVRTYGNGGCTVLTGEISTLATVRSTLASAGDHALLPELITKELRAPAVRINDEGWFSVVRWVAMALIQAEEMAITQDNVDEMRSSVALDIRRFIGEETDLGTPLGLARDWVYQVIRQTGNYGEIFERALGASSTLRLDRGLNNISSKGGLLYAAPLR